ncbi:SIR2 family NAD-dependent protein deacylase [Methanoculleus frigidifontis]|nr:SIR2 family protein [Methanoculleus sp. FWC-SCC1]
MNSKLPLDDQIHIEQIRKYLWSGREYGKAAVMVGSGFSRNAERFSQNTRLFPLWNDLGVLFYDALNPKWGEHASERAYSTSGANAVKYASEYEAKFGRLALNNLLLENIPDNEYFPGNLHELLLSLPWSDVFTTNYDTLLERTLPRIFDKKYDIIQNINQIPTKIKPRVIKLHGSFPSNFPFIITQKDYEDYPTDFAPFTNLVQQSVMENIFCLIGFSGDDPNFTRWVEWVRKYLGKYAPPIYLCGVLDADQAERDRCEANGVKMIDLAPLFPRTEWPDTDERHRCALEWFLWTLKLGEPQNKLRWPKPARIPQPNLSSCFIPQIPPGTPPLPDLGSQGPKDNNISPEELLELSKKWREQRLHYPGWVVTPGENRAVIWNYTHYWINPVANSVRALHFPDNLYLLFELIWRLEKSLVPLFSNVADVLRELLVSINPYPQIIHLDSAEYRPDDENARDFNWKQIGESWVYLAFAMARQTREFFDESEHRQWMDRLEKVGDLKKEWKIRYCYEDSLYNLFKFDHDQVFKILETWPEDYDIPHFAVKRAAILAELGELTEAERTLRATLTRIRSHLQSNIEDYALLSQEGWTMNLLSMVDYSNSWTSGDTLREEYHNRWDRLGHYRCNPQPEIERLTAGVSTPPQQSTPQIERKKDFDPGRVTNTLHFASDQDVERSLPAFSFLRMYEEAGMPMKCGLISVYSDEIANASDRIEALAPLWSLNTIIRSRKTDRVKKRFNRAFIAAISQEQVDTYHSLLLDSFQKSVQYLIENPSINHRRTPSFQYQQVQTLSELLSRLCIRFSPSELSQLLDLTIRMYKNPVFYRDPSVYDGIKQLFQRILHSMTKDQTLSLLPRLLSLPVANEDDYHPAVVSHWVEPFHYINLGKSASVTKNFDQGVVKSQIERLTRIVRVGNDEARSRALLRLVSLVDIGALDEVEEREFADALWERIDPETGLPDQTPFLKSAFFRLPEIENGGSKEKFRKYLSSMPIPRIVVRNFAPDGRQIGVKAHSAGGVLSDYLDEWGTASPPITCPDICEDDKYIDWTPEELSALLFKIAEVWDDLKDLLGESGKTLRVFSLDSLDSQFSGLVRLMNNIILPRIRRLQNKEAEELIFRLLSEMEKLGVDVLSAYPFVLLIDSSYYEQVTAKLRDGIISPNPSKVRDALIGIYHWVCCSRNESSLSPPEDLLNELVHKISTRRQPELDTALKIAAAIVERCSDALSQEQLQELYIGLEYLSAETDLAHEGERDVHPDQPDFIPLDDKPDIRRHSAALAHYLYNYCTAHGEGVPDVLNKWKQICETDPLPEVRKAWEE